MLGKDTLVDIVTDYHVLLDLLECQMMLCSRLNSPGQAIA